MLKNKTLPFKRLLFAAILALAGAGCADKTPPSPRISVLFIGNSFFYTNNLPLIFTQLAESSGSRVDTGLAAQGGWKLFQHASSADTLGKIAEKKWDFVVLQEQSVVPAVEREREDEMYPAVRSLNGTIRQAGAVPVLFMTWGRRDGFPEVGFNDYSTMQEQLDLGYMGIAGEIGAETVPAGPAWRKALEARPGFNLWAVDGIHPGLTGSYLAACALYSVFYRKSPEGLATIPGVPEETARFLQSIAAQTVLTDPKAWNLK